MRSTDGEINHRVLPDGCTDLIFSIMGGRVRASAVGAMTQPLISPLQSGEEIFGVRFHPGMSHGLLRVPVGLLTDQVVEFESLWGREARELAQRIAETPSNEERLALLEDALPSSGPETQVQRTAIWIVENRGD